MAPWPLPGGVQLLHNSSYCGIYNILSPDLNALIYNITPADDPTAEPSLGTLYGPKGRWCQGQLLNISYDPVHNRTVVLSSGRGSLYQCLPVESILLNNFTIWNATMAGSGAPFSGTIVSGGTLNSTFLYVGAIFDPAQLNCTLRTSLTNVPPPPSPLTGRRRLLQAPEPPPPLPAAAPSPLNSSGLLAPPSPFSSWSLGPVGLYTNRPPSTAEFLTVARINKTAFYLMAPNGHYLAANNQGQLVASASKRSQAAIFLIAQESGDRQVVLQIGDGRYVGWGGPEGVGALTLRSDLEFQNSYGGNAANLAKSDLYTWNVREAMEVARIRGMNLGGWLVLEEWMTPDLYSGVPNYVDGAQLQLQSVTTGKWLSGATSTQVKCSAPSAGDAETWAIRRVDNDLASGKVQLRILKTGHYLQVLPGSNGQAVVAESRVPAGDGSDIFIMQMSKDSSRLMLQASSGQYLMVHSDGTVQAAAGTGDWNGDTAFNLNLVKAVQGEYQISAYATDAASRVANHRKTFIQENDWAYLARMGVNTVRIPVGYWIAQGTQPDSPFIPGSDAALDNAFAMAEKYNIRIWLSMHAAPGGQNHGSECASRDGVIDWEVDPTYNQTTINTIDWLANRYSKSPAFFGIGVLNEPNKDGISLASLQAYLEAAYRTVRKYSPCAYVGITPRLEAPASDFDGFMTDPLAYNNVVFDMHYYNVYELATMHDSSLKDQFDFIVHQRREEVNHLTQGGRTVLVGEWSLALPEITKASVKDYITFSLVQMNIYANASAGWFFWSYKVAEGSTGFPNWSMQSALTKGWLQYY